MDKIDNMGNLKKTLISCYTNFVSDANRLRNVTVTLEEDVAQWARIEAARKDTSVSRLLGALLKERMASRDGSVAEVAERLNELAHAQNLSENEIIAKALDVFFSLANELSLDRRSWAASSEGAFSKVWDNVDDARYDNWREMYGVPAR